MSISIYYTARRSSSLTDSERKAIKKVVGRYSVRAQIEDYQQTGSGWNGEDFCLYDPPFDSPDIILQGATKLPDAKEDVFILSILHWCEALSKIRRLLPDARWHVHIDGQDVLWNEKKQVFGPT